jgi:hypothetical protein
MGENYEFDSKWAEMLSDSDEHIRRIAERAFREPSLRRLFPFASHSNLKFSRRAEYPYNVDIPYVLTKPSGQYEARTGDHALLGCGDVDAVIELVVNALGIHSGTEPH